MEQRREMIARRDPEKAKANDRARYYRNRAKRRAAMDAYHDANRERVADHKRAWAERNPEKIKAQNAVGSAIRDGLLTRGRCASSGPECSGQIEGHHEDYSKPLEVVWLCTFHHGLTRRIAA